ncbi:hypothetical protein GCM10011579_022680 [Streptomyces albiflavescens]|uniref:Uncharacterized protein n=1 Tax=Streptomyces albiflavescens TaxID=1623582 RepID=A0A918D2D0_9ACTN|nr:hypothetical protein [Streptomyces albiflavescens]GGN58834.1 hypothetical protein GCM10011579_022680 [Streptomyces albiflavescens]
MDTTATITAHAQVTTLINVFTVKPENQRALVDLLVKTTDAVMRQLLARVKRDLPQQLAGEHAM